MDWCDGQNVSGLNVRPPPHDRGGVARASERSLNMRVENKEIKRCMREY